MKSMDKKTFSFFCIADNGFCSPCRFQDHVLELCAAHAAVVPVDAALKRMLRKKFLLIKHHEPLLSHGKCTCGLSLRVLE